MMCIYSCNCRVHTRSVDLSPSGVQLLCSHHSRGQMNRFQDWQCQCFSWTSTTSSMLLEQLVQVQSSDTHVCAFVPSSETTTSRGRLHESVSASSQPLALSKVHFHRNVFDTMTGTPAVRHVSEQQSQSQCQLITS
jgi:hypothetical protein